jgi:hypothetical protein
MMAKEGQGFEETAISNLGQVFFGRDEKNLKSLDEYAPSFRGRWTGPIPRRKRRLAGSVASKAGN